MGFYIVPEMQHFRKYYCYIPTTIVERVSNTFKFFPAHVDIPKTSSEERLTQVTQDLLTVLKNPHPRTLFLYQGDKTSNYINKLQSIFQHPQLNDTSKNSSPPRLIVTSNQYPRVIRSDVARRKYPRVEKMETRK